MRSEIMINVFQNRVADNQSCGLPMSSLKVDGVLQVTCTDVPNEGLINLLNGISTKD